MFRNFKDSYLNTSNVNVNQSGIGTMITRFYYLNTSNVNVNRL